MQDILAAIVPVTPEEEARHRNLKRLAQIPVEHEARRGRCFELAARYTVADIGTGATLVHGVIFNPSFSINGPIFHGWLELGWGAVFDPVADWLMAPAVHADIFNPHVVARYTEDETRKEMLRSNHWGPWHADMDNPATLARGVGYPVSSQPE